MGGCISWRFCVLCVYLPGAVRLTVVLTMSPFSASDARQHAPDAAEQGPAPALSAQVRTASANPPALFVFDEPCDGSDWRLPHIIAAYNREARSAAAEGGVEYLDTFAVAFPVLELSFDGWHYQVPCP